MKNTKIAEINFICAILVLLIHVGPVDQHAPTWLLYQYVQGGFCQIAVPFFFLFSGYFLALHYEEEGWYGFAVRKRIVSLLMPTVIWGVLFGVFALVLRLVANIVAKRPILVNVFDFQIFLSWFGLNQSLTYQHGALWYMRTLFILVLISPYLFKVLRTYSYLAVLILYVISCVIPLHSLTPGMNISCEVVNGLPFFAFGACVALRGILLFNHRLKRGGGGLLVLGMVFIPLWHQAEISSSVMMARLLRAVAIPSIMIGLWSMWRILGIPNWLLGLSFPIYLIHTFVLTVAGLFISPSTIMGMCIKAFVGLVITIMIALFMRRHMPRISILLFGGR